MTHWHKDTTCLVNDILCCGVLIKVIASSRTLGFWPDDLDDPVVGQAGVEAGVDIGVEFLPAQFTCYDPFDVSPASPSPSQKLRDLEKPILVPLVNPGNVDKRNRDISLENFRPKVQTAGPDVKAVIKPVEPCVPIDLTVDEAVPVLDLSQTDMDLSQCDELLSRLEEEDPNYMLVDWPRPVFVEDYKQLSEGTWLGTQLMDFYMYHVYQNLNPDRQNDIHLFTTDFYRALTIDRQTRVRDANLFDKGNQLFTELSQHFLCQAIYFVSSSDWQGNNRRDNALIDDIS